MATTDAFHEYKGGIFYDDTGYLDVSHEVSIVGYGEQNGVKFWRVRNSWGAYWGENGFFRIVRGVNNLAIESDCSWATPVDDFTARHTTTTAEQSDPNNDQTVYPFPQPTYDGNEVVHEGCRGESYFTSEPIKKSKRSWETIPVDKLPD